MSANIEQIYIANPTTTPVTTDLIYLGKSPYGPTDNSAVSYADFILALNGASPGQVQSSTFNKDDSTNIGDAYSVTLTPAPVTIGDALLVSMTASATNTTTGPTLSVNGTAAKHIQITSGLVAPGDIVSGNVYFLQYNLSTQLWILINPSVSQANTYSVQKNLYNYSVGSGIPNAYIVTLTPTPQSLTSGLSIFFQVSNALTNTGSSTLTVNGTTDPIYYANGVDLVGGEILANSISEVVYTTNFGGAWLLQNPAINSFNLPVSRIVVSLDTTLTPYNTVSAGIAAAEALSPTLGNPVTVWILDGTYTEDITFASNVNLAAASLCPHGSGVTIRGSATYSCQNVLVTGITFRPNTITPAISFTSAGAAVAQFSSCDIEAVGAVGVSLNAGSTTLYFYNSSVNSGSAGQAWNIQNGTVVCYNLSSTNIATSSVISGGQMTLYGGSSSDSYDLTGGSGVLLAYNTTFVSNLPQAFNLGASAILLLVGGFLDTVDVGPSTVVGGTGVFVYASLSLGIALNFATTLTVQPSMVAGGSNNVLALSTTATASGTTTLTAASNYRQYFTGTLAQIVQMPIVSTLIPGMSFYIKNNSTNTLTVNSSGSNLIQSMLPGSTFLITCISQTGTTAASWDGIYDINVNGTFNPTLTFGGGSTGLVASTNGDYTQIGNTITFSLSILLSSKGSSTGVAVIAGMPLNGRGTVVSQNFVIIANGLTFIGTPAATLSGVSSDIDLYDLQSVTGGLPMDNTNFSNTTEVYISGTYLI